MFLTLGSLFDGSGGFPLAGMLEGIAPLWASEIEPFPIRVTTNRFPGMKHLGSVTDVDGAKVEPVDIITFGSPCFPAGTLILTSDGYMPIEDVSVGDNVLTHAGRWKRVTAVGSHESETIILRGNHYGLECTPNHPIYSATVGKDYSRKEDGKRNNKLVLKNERSWLPAVAMGGKYWGVPRKIDPLPFDIPVRTNAKENDMPEMNADFWYFVGRWVGDGWVRNGQRSGRPDGQRFSTIYLCGGFDEEDELVDTVSKISEHYSVERGNTGVKIKLNGRILCDWLVRNFGCYATEKNIASWIYGIEPEYRKSFLRGVIDSDGNKMNTVTESYNIATSSEKLANSLRIIAELEGYSTTIHRFICKPTTVIEGRLVNVHPESYQVRITKSERSRIHLCDDLQSWYLVRSVECTGESKQVYNMTVEDDNSYIANGIVVHNCQDLSVAGKRLGIHDGERSNLFFEAIRIIKEMRHATADKYPRFAVWENVPGAFSSNGGEDFRCVLEELAGVKCADVSIPAVEKWENAGELVGDAYSLAWRTLDAQYWGVPQRRRRIFLVADFDGERAGEILFNTDCEPGNTAQSSREGQRTAAGAERCVRAGGELCLNSGIYKAETSRTLDTRGGNPACNQGGIAIVAAMSRDANCAVSEDITPPVVSTGPGVIALNNNHTAVSEGLTESLTARQYKDPPVVSYPQTLRERCGCEGGGKGPLIQADKSAALACNNDQTLSQPDKSQYIVRRLTPTECARLQGFPDWWCAGLETENPTAEEISFWRGVFDTFSNVTGAAKKNDKQIIKWLQNPHSDSAEYKMWGNGVALPCVRFVLRAIAKEARKCS